MVGRCRGVGLLLNGFRLAGAGSFFNRLTGSLVIVELSMVSGEVVKVGRPWAQGQCRLTPVQQNCAPPRQVIEYFHFEIEIDSFEAKMVSVHFS
jgi:hypothetical protein